MAQYVPTKDQDFAAWLLNLATLITATPATYGLTAPDAVVISNVQTTFAAALTAATDPATRTKGTVALKDVARATAEATVRPYAVQISANSSVTDQDKADVGVTIRKTIPTPIPAPTDAPALSLVKAIPLQTTVQAVVPGAIGKAKPFGSIGLEVHVSIGTVAATDPAQCRYVGTYAKIPFRLNFDAADQGKVATMFARYVTRSGPAGVAQRGPWSSPLTTFVI